MREEKSIHPAMVIIAIALASILCTSVTHAQRATEVFIPIGQSPGLSAKYTTIGTVDSLDLKREMLVVSASRRLYTIRYTRDTRIYIDRSSSGSTNSRGTMMKCKKGMIVEVKYLDNKTGANAEWIKIKE